MVDHNRLPKAWRLPSPTRRTGNERPVDTLEEAIEIEPQIGILLDMAGREKDADFHTYEEYKRQLLLLAGWYATKPRLATEEVYMIVIDALVERLGV